MPQCHFVSDPFPPETWVGPLLETAMHLLLDRDICTLEPQDVPVVRFSIPRPMDEHRKRVGHMLQTNQLSKTLHTTAFHVIHEIMQYYAHRPGPLSEHIWACSQHTQIPLANDSERIRLAVFSSEFKVLLQQYEKIMKVIKKWIELSFRVKERKCVPGGEEASKQNSQRFCEPHR